MGCSGLPGLRHFLHPRKLPGMNWSPSKTHLIPLSLLHRLLVLVEVNVCTGAPASASNMLGDSTPSLSGLTLGTEPGQQMCSMPTLPPLPRGALAPHAHSVSPAARQLPPAAPPARGLWSLLPQGPAQTCREGVRSSLHWSELAVSTLRASPQARDSAQASSSPRT